MAVESIHYHGAKDPYHTIYDDTARIGSITTTEEFENCNGVKELLGFYHACCHGCHSETLLGSDASNASLNRSSGVVQSLKNAVERARMYLVERSMASVSAHGGDITIFFDRLLAKLFLLKI